MKRHWITLGFLLALVGIPSFAVAEGEPLRVKTDRFEAQLNLGSVVSLVDPTGHVYVRPGKESLAAGIHSTGGIYWATAAQGPTRLDDQPATTRYRGFSELGEASAESVIKIDRPSGDLVLRQQCSSPAKGVWGVSWSIGMIPLDYSIIVPGHSGIRLTAATPASRMEFDYPMSWEAQLVIVEGRERGFYVWADDTKGRFKRLIVQRHATGWQLTLVTINFAPFDPLDTCQSVAWRLNTYEGDWRVPARRYRQWMESQFQPTPIEKQQPGWVKDIRCLVIMGMDRDLMASLAKRLDPAQTVLYIPAWRAAGYDRDYPVYDQPLPELDGFVREAHQLGFRVMLHVNYFGVDPLNPLYAQFERYQVRSPWGKHERLWWLWTRSEPEIRFAYINPAFKAWRDHFVAAMAKLCRQSGVDSLHLDQTLCIYNDHNGLIDGMSMLEGNVALHRELREALPQVALSGEGLNEVTCRYEAFAQRHAWGLNHADGTWDRPRLAAAHPISSYLLRPYTIINGYLGCAPPTNGQLYAAWNEAYEHWGVIPTLKPSNADMLKPQGFSRQFFDEAAFWQKQRLDIDLEGDWPADVAFPWRTADSRRVIRTCDGCLRSGDTEISRTITGVRQLATAGSVPGWQAYDRERILGLDPQCWYPCVLEPRDLAQFHVAELPADAVVESIARTGEMAMVRTRTGVDTIVDLAAKLTEATCGSRPVAGDAVEVTGPLAAADGAMIADHGTMLSAHPPWKTTRKGPQTETPAQGTGQAFARFSLALPSASRLRLISDVALDHGAIGKSDGVTFAISARCGETQLRQELNVTTDQPQTLQLDLTPLAGRQVQVELSVHPGPKGNASFDWARWYQPRIERLGAAQGPIALAGPDRWVAALGDGGRLAIEGTADGQRVIAPSQGTVFWLRQSPKPVQLPVTLAGQRRIVVYADSSGQPLESPEHANVAARPNTVGGVTKDSLFAHPPNSGRTMIHLPMVLPNAPGVFHSWVGLRDGSKSDGVVFIVEVNGREVARRRMVPGQWEPLVADLAAWAGKPVVLSLITDSDGTFSFDWAAWGEPRIKSKP